MNRLPLVQRVLLYGALLALVATGLAWEWLDPGPWAAFLMKIHGALAMLADGLVDELHLFVYPLAVGSGPRLFADGASPCKLELIASETYSSGVVRLSYHPLSA